MSKRLHFTAPECFVPKQKIDGHLDHPGLSWVSRPVIETSFVERNYTRLGHINQFNDVRLVEQYTTV